MAPSRKVPRYAHSDGHTAICYSTDGKYLITCGSEGDIRIWHGFEDDDPTEKCVGEKAFAVAQVADKLYVGTDHNNVQAFSFPTAELDRICTRFTAPVTCISIVKDWLVAGSSDMKVHAFNLSSGAEKVISCHSGPILEVALDPQLEYLATSCCDGLVRVFSMDSIVNSEDACPAQTWPDFIPKSNDFETSPVSCRLAWSSSEDRWLAIPHQGKVHVYQSGSWNKAFTLAYDGCEFQVVRFSPCGQYLAAGGHAGDILVWSLADRQVLYCTQDRKAAPYAAQDRSNRICSLEWNPGDSSQLAYCDTEGQLGLIEQLLDPSSPPLTNGYTEHIESILPPDEIGEAMLIDNEEDDENEISLDKIKAESGFLPDDQEGRGAPASPSVADEDRTTPMSGMYPPVAGVPLTELQPAFQPTSTPAHFQYRFMVYNDVGIVRHTNTDEENSIDVEFHDSSVHHSFRINNVMGHSMAALSNQALVLACERDEDKPSKLSCIVINSWDGSKEWSMEMPDEDIAAVAAGANFIAAATDRRLLRIFSVGGLQREVISLPGPVVCLNAKDNLLLAVYHSGQGVPEDQSLAYSLIHTGSLHKSRGPLPLPISPRATLRWAGFSEEGSLLSYDSECVLRLSQSTLWRPVCFMDDLTKGKSDHYFLVGVSEIAQLVRCILCKGCFYPATVPRPILTQVSWKIPLCEPNAEKSELEEQFWRKHLALSSVPSQRSEEFASIMKEVIAPAVKLFALSCKTDNELRAVELCEMFSNPQFLQLATRYASTTGKSGLADRVADLKSGHQGNTRSTPEHQEPTDDLGYGQSQNDTMDMFEEDSYQPSPDSSNIILAMKHKQVVIKPQNVVLGRVNPFKRSGGGSSNGSIEDKPKTDTIAEMTIKSQPKPAPPPVTNTAENKSSAKDKSSSKPQMKFTEWFSREKENLESEFPDLDKPALNKVAMKRFKELHSQKSTPAAPAGAAATAQANSVRNFFSLGRKQESQTQGSTDSQNSQDTTVIPSSQETNNENENGKKRKLEEKEEPIDSANPKKPLTAANKLKAFSFSK